MEDNSYYQIGDYNVSRRCLETFPCRHRIVNVKTGEVYLFGSAMFYETLKEKGLSHPHFDKYADFVKQQAEREQTIRNEARHIAEEMQEQRAKQAEENVIADKFKSFTYLEKLKSKLGV